MSEISLFLLGVGFSSLFGIAAVVYIRKPLRTILLDLCGTEERAQFWTQITVLSFVLMTALDVPELPARRNSGPILLSQRALEPHFGRTVIDQPDF